MEGDQQRWEGENNFVTLDWVLTAPIQHVGIAHSRQASSQFPGRKSDVWVVWCSRLFRGRTGSVFPRGEEHVGLWSLLPGC